MRVLATVLSLLFAAAAAADSPPTAGPTGAARLEPARVQVVIAVPVTRVVVGPDGEKRFVTEIVNVLHAADNPRARSR